jgi:hypothetical protein
MDKVGNTYFIEPDPLTPARPFKRMIEAKDTICDPSRYRAPSRGPSTRAMMATFFYRDLTVAIIATAYAVCPRCGAVG